MGSDLRTSTRDLLALSQKVATLLQRHSDRLLGQVESAQESLEHNVEAEKSEQYQQAIDLRRRLWETSKRLRAALEHVEDIEDEDEPRILREPMDELQVLVKEALQIAAVSNPGQHDSAGPGSGSESSSSTAATSLSGPLDLPKGLPIPRATTLTMAPGTPPLGGSVHRHPLGLFSTSPKFTAQSPFNSTGRTTGSRLSALGNLSSPLALPPSTTTATTIEPIAPIPNPTTTPTSTLISVTEGPLSIATQPMPVRARVEKSADLGRPDSAATSSSLSSAASYSTPITSPLDRPFSPARTLNSGAAINSSTPLTSANPAAPATPPPHQVNGEGTPGKMIDSPQSPPRQRRVPRGLFSTSTSSPESSSGAGSSQRIRTDPLFHGSTSETRKALFPEEEPKFSQESKPRPIMKDLIIVPVQDLESALGKAQLEEESRPCTLGATRSPRTSTSSPSSTALPSIPSTPSSAHAPLSPLVRSQPKPSPIQTTTTGKNSRGALGAGSIKGNICDEEPLSQLAKDLDKAMNPTPTEPVPQPYFLQGKGLLQRIPSQVSMDDGLLDENGDEDDAYSEVEEESAEAGSSLNRGHGSLRRSRSGKRRSFRLTRSKSRNGFRGRQENGQANSSSKPALAPIEVGYPSVLTSSEWPFGQSPPAPTPLETLHAQAQAGSRLSRSRQTRSPPMGSPSLTASQLLAQQVSRHQQQQVSRHQQQQQQQQQWRQHPLWQQQERSSNPALLPTPLNSTLRPYRAGPHLPFADSVTIESPIRVGRGIGSFTVYSITLTLCDPAKAAHPSRTPSPPSALSAAASSLTSPQQQDLLHVQPQQQQQEQVSSHANLSKPSQAALMMTRSLSFPELGFSAERLLMEIQSPARETFQSLSPPHSSLAVAAQPVAQSTPSPVAPPPPPPPRVIVVRKRYSDFVTLRAQLVETFQDRRRSNPFGRSRKDNSNSNNIHGLQGGHLRSGSTATAESRRHGQGPTSDDDEEEGGAMGYDGAHGSLGYTHVIRESHSSNNGHPSNYQNKNNNKNNNSNNNNTSRTNTDANSVSAVIPTSSLIRGLPKLPPKKVVGKFRPAFVEKRRRELEYFLEWVVAHPIMGDCPVVVQWFLGEHSPSFS